MPSIFLRTIGSIIRHSAHQSNHPNGIPIRSDCISILELTSTGLGIALECVAHIVLIVLIELVQCQNRKNHLSPFLVVPKSSDNRASDVAQDALLACAYIGHQSRPASGYRLSLKLTFRARPIR